MDNMALVFLHVSKPYHQLWLLLLLLTPSRGLTDTLLEIYR